MDFHEPEDAGLLNSAFMSEDFSSLTSDELIDYARALQAEKLRLQMLVCHLLRENEHLRHCNSEDEPHEQHEKHNNHAPHSPLRFSS